MQEPGTVFATGLLGDRAVAAVPFEYIQCHGFAGLLPKPAHRRVRFVTSLITSYSGIITRL